jgi:hypothetical protein
MVSLLGESKRPVPDTLAVRERVLTLKTLSSAFPRPKRDLPRFSFVAQESRHLGVIRVSPAAASKCGNGQLPLQGLQQL